MERKQEATVQFDREGTPMERSRALAALSDSESECSKTAIGGTQRATFHGYTAISTRDTCIFGDKTSRLYQAHFPESHTEPLRAALPREGLMPNPYIWTCWCQWVHRDVHVPVIRSAQCKCLTLSSCVNGLCSWEQARGI